MADIFVNIVGSYKELDKAYVNINGVWKEVESVWVNIGGVWKEVGLDRIIQYHSSLGLVHENIKVINFAAGSTTNHAVVTGGDNLDGTHYKTVTAYDANLVRITGSDLTRTTSYHCGVSFMGSFLSAGGMEMSYGSYQIAYVNRTHPNLTRTTLSNLAVSVYNPVGASTSTHAIIGGGYSRNGYSSTMNAYNSTFVKVTAPTALTQPADDMGCTTVGNYALFGGGKYGDWDVSNVVDAYSTTLVKTSAPPLLNRTRPAAATVGDKAVFFGTDYYGTDNGATVYNSSLVRTTISNPPGIGDEWLYAGSLGDVMLVGRGVEISGSTIIYSYNSSLVRTDVPNSIPKLYRGSRLGSVNDYLILFNWNGSYAFKAV